jgi:hypothetical protein
MHFETSPGSSPSKSIPIRAMASPSGSLYSTFSYDTAPSTRGSTCAYPSWPEGRSLQYGSCPSSFISDEDLFFDELDGPLLKEAPAPPRQPPVTQAFPVLPPLYPTEKAKPKSNKTRRSSSRKQRRSSKPMTPISESPEAVE